MEGAEIRLAIGNMHGPNDLHGSCIVAGPDLTDRAELAVISLFVFKDAKARCLGFDLPVRCLELSLRAGLLIDIRRKSRNFRTDEVKIVTGVAAYRIANASDANRRMDSVLAFRHDMLSIAGQCQGSSCGHSPEVTSEMTDSVCGRKTHRGIRFSHLFANRVKNSADAIRSRLSTRELNPDVGQPETVSDSPLGRYNAIRGNAAVMNAHAAVHKDRVEIGLSIIQLKNCLTLLALVGEGAILDFRYGSFGLLLNLPDVVEKFQRGFWRRLRPIGHYALVGVANLAVAARVSECRGRIVGIRNPHAVKRDVECRFACGCCCHALADGAHVAVDALDPLIRVLTARQTRASSVHLPVRLLRRPALAVARLAELLGRLP